MRGKPGFLVETKGGKVGRTYNNKPLINGKIPVYLATKMREIKDRQDNVILSVPEEYETIAILCDPASLKTIGIID